MFGCDHAEDIFVKWRIVVCVLIGKDDQWLIIVVGLLIGTDDQQMHCERKEGKCHF